MGCGHANNYVAGNHNQTHMDYRVQSRVSSPRAAIVTVGRLTGLGSFFVSGYSSPLRPGHDDPRRAIVDLQG